ncbi:MAG: lysylphosphatidylglycerol synthase transmembrane domain-containing protein [Candidatus Aenigmatarchaeota archaeon]
MKNNVIKLAGLFIVGSAIFLAVFSFVGWEKIISAISQLYIPLYIAFIGLSVLDIFVWSSKWGIFVRKDHPHVSHLDLVKNLLVGMAMNYLTPVFKAGGEPARIYLLKKKNNVRGREGLATVTSDLTMEFIIDGILVLLAMIFFLIFFSPPLWIYGVLAIFILMSSVIVFGLVGIYTGRKIFYKLIEWVCGRVKRLEGYEKKIKDAYETFRENFRGIMSDRKLFVKGLLLTVFRKVIILSKYYILFVALGYEISPVVILIFIGIGYMLMMVPATPGSLGVFEGGMVSVFVLLGVPAGISATMVFLDRLVWFWGILAVGGSLGVYYGVDFLESKELSFLDEDVYPGKKG